MDFNKLWKFAYEAYKGSGGFADGAYIDKYPRESEEKYKARKEIAYYSNLFAPAVNRFIGYIFKDKPVRTSTNDFVRLIFDDCNSRGDSIDVFISSFAKTAKVRGVGLILVDMPKELPDNRADQIKMRAVPYLVEIPPESIISYKMDKFGKFEYIKYNDTIDRSTPQKQDRIEVERYYDAEKWEVTYKNEIIGDGEHSLGVCPVLAFGENGIFPDVGEFTGVAQLAKRHYNLKSELDEILRGQTFSVLTLQADNPADYEIKLATDNAIVYGNGSERPDFIAPKDAPAKTYQEEIAQLEALIDRSTYNFTTNKAPESGISLEIKFQGLNSSLSNFAMRLEDFEARIFDLVCKYLDITNDVTISYKKDFALSDVMQEIEILDSIKSLGYELPTYESLKLMQIINNDLNAVEVEDAEKIRVEIEDILKKT